MIEKYRELFNSQFSEQKYQNLKDDIASDFDYLPSFRIAETPFFIPNTLKDQLIEGCQEVISFISQNNFKAQTQKAVPPHCNVPNEDNHTTFLAIDFGICIENEKIIPKLIEVQGFPSLFNYQMNLYEKFQNHYPFLDELTPFINGISKHEYLSILQKIICGNHLPEDVILLEIEPEKQNTKIDFYYCERDLGVAVVCVTAVIKKRNKLYYTNKLGKQKQIKRIYNRVIFDELEARTDLDLNFSFTDSLDVEWAGHPNWFFRISKFILPLLKGKYCIETTLLSELDEIPADLENYVLKPLFSFAGSGVIFHVTHLDIENVVEKDLYILQKKVTYAPIIQSPNGKVKAEVRILCTWDQNDSAPNLLCNLVRLSRGEMIGVKFNKDADWVGGSIGLFEK